MTQEQPRQGANVVTGEIVELGTAPAPRTVFGTDSPAEIAAMIAAMAGPLAEFIDQRGMTQTIQGRKYVVSEGWSFMGAMLGVHARTARSEPMRDDAGVIQGYTAEVELVMRDGSVVGGAIAECSRTEKDWGWQPKARDGRPLQPRPDPALRSMAQTRAANKAYRMTYGFVMKAAGFDVESEDHDPRDAGPPAQGSQAPGPRGQGAGRRDPVPPQSRAEPLPGGTPKQDAEPAWMRELWSRMRTQAVMPEHLQKFLGLDRNVIEAEDIQAWLAEGEGRTVADLVQAVAVAMSEPAGEASNAGAD